MPKGIHDSASDLSLVLGHEMQLRVHANPGFDASSYYDTAKGLMINTVEMASYNSIPTYSQRVELSDGTLIIARLSYGRQVVEIYPTGGEDVSPKKALFRVIPYVGYPQAVIIADDTKPSGIKMEFASDIRGGSGYSQEADSSEELLSFDKNVSDIMAGGSGFSTDGDKNVYVGGYLLVTIARGFPGEMSVIGAALVQDSMYCFIINYLGSIEVYSHTKINIDYGSQDFTNPLISFSSLVLVKTTALGSPFTGNHGSTLCSFSEDGEKARFGALIGRLGSGSAAHTKQSIFNYSFSVNSGILNATLNREDKTSYRTLTRSLNAASMVGNVASSVTLGDVDPYYSGPPEISHRVHAYNEESAYQDIDESTEYSDYVLNGDPISLGISLKSNGVIINSGYILYGSLDKEGSVDKITLRSGSHSGTFYRGSNHTQSIVSSGIASNSQIKTIGDGITSHIYYPAKGHLNLNYEKKTTYELPWGNLLEKEKVVSNPLHDDWVIGFGLGRGELLAASYFNAWSELYDGLSCQHTPCPPNPTETWYIIPKAASSGSYGTFSGTAKLEDDKNKLIDFDLRLSCGISAKIIAPFKLNPMVYYDNPNNKTVWCTNPNSTDPLDVDNSLKLSRYYTFHSKFGDVDVPGLNKRYGNLDIDPPYDCTSRTPYYFIENDPSLGNDTSATYAVPPPISTTGGTRCSFITHPKNYILYSLNDYYITSSEVTPPKVKTVLTLYNGKTNNHIDILKMYNDLMASEPLVTLSALEVSRTGIDQDDIYIESAGVIGTLPNVYGL